MTSSKIGLRIRPYFALAKQVVTLLHRTNSRVEGKFDNILAADVVLLEGILVFYHKEVRDLFDMKLWVYVNT